MAVNTSQEDWLSGVPKNLCSEGFRNIFFPTFTTEGLNDPYASKALKEQIAERTPLEACSNFPNIIIVLLATMLSC